MNVINHGFQPVREIQFFDGKSIYLPQRQLKQYNLRVVRSGDVLEIYKYENPVHYNYESLQTKHEREKPDEWNGKSEKNLARARQTIRRIIWANLTRYSKFLTLTYSENMQDLEQFYYDWKMFTQGMRRKGHDLKYLYVLEYQERGAIHAHVLIFGDRFIPWQDITDSWGKGIIDIHKIRDIGNLGAYVCKYLTKDTLAEYNSKSFHTSRGLKRPIERKITLDEEETATFLSGLLSKGQIVYSNEYDVTYNDIVANKVNYCQMKIADNFLD